MDRILTLRPQGLKPGLYLGRDGTAEAVPFPQIFFADGAVGRARVDMGENCRSFDCVVVRFARDNFAQDDSAGGEGGTASRQPARRRRYKKS